MPAPVNRISVTTASLRQQKLLEYQAGLTGRSISSLASSLLEEIVDQKVREGRWEPTAVRMVDELITAKTWVEGPGHDELLARLAQESIDAQGDIHCQKVDAINDDPSLQIEIEEHDSLVPKRDQPQPSYFAARFAENVKAAAESAEAAKAANREAELVKYGIRYGLEREVAEDIYERCANRFGGTPRYKIRQEMREAAGFEGRLAEGDEVLSNAADTNTTVDLDDCPF